MNCLNHPDTRCVSTCPDCRAGLCHPCSNHYGIIICDRCNERRLSNEVNRLYKEIAGTLLMAGVLVLVFVKVVMPASAEGISPDSVMMVDWTDLLYPATALIVGWKSLSSFTGRMFLWLPLVGWVIYFVVKLFFAFVFGLVWLPFWLGKKIFRIVKLKRWQKNNRWVVAYG